MFGLFKLRMGSADLATNSMAFFNKDKCTLDCLNLATRLENDYYNSRKGDINNLTSHSTALRFSIYYKKIRELNLFQESAFNLVDFKEKLIKMIEMNHGAFEGSLNDLIVNYSKDNNTIGNVRTLEQDCFNTRLSNNDFDHLLLLFTASEKIFNSTLKKVKITSFDHVYL